MRAINDIPTFLGRALPDVRWEAPDFALATDSGERPSCRLWRVSEIGDLGATANRLAMTNVLCGANAAGCSFVYLLAGRPEGVSLYLGVASTSAQADLPEAGRTLRAAFEGNFLGAKLRQVNEGDRPIAQLLDGNRHLGILAGVPGFNETSAHNGGEDVQGVERLVNVMAGETWQFVLTAQAGSQGERDAAVQSILELCTLLSTRPRYSTQQSRQEEEECSGTTRTSTSNARTDRTSDVNERSKSGDKASRSGNQDKSETKSEANSASNTRTESEDHSHGVTRDEMTGKNTAYRDTSGKLRELRDARGELLENHVRDTLLERFLQGNGKGMFKTTVFLGATTLAAYERLANSTLAIFQGLERNLTPLRVHKLPAPARSLEELLAPRLLAPDAVAFEQVLIHSVPYSQRRAAAASWLDVRELALLAGLPNVELPGLKLRPSVDFGLNTVPAPAGQAELRLGSTVQHGRVLGQRPLGLPVSELNKHVFITGVTGAGKTTTCMKLLDESGLPFLVIEPAKTEYRALHAIASPRPIHYYILGREDLTPFRLNPFELVESEAINLAGHVAQLTATLAAVFPMEAAMPYLVEEAIVNAYKARGWDVHAGENVFHPSPWAEGSTAWPTFSDLVRELKSVVASKGMGEDFSAKYLGSLVAQLSNLTLGIKGRMLNTPRSMDFNKLLDDRVVIELEEMKNEQDKALLMGLIIGRVADCMKQRYLRRQPGEPEFRHLTLVEEAHRLLSRPEPGDGGARKAGVEMFANLLAEVRKYGEGLIIADQIPNKLIPDVIKNTNIKIVHRLFAADDRHAIGDTMGLNERQKDFLPLLQQGQAVVYCGGWHAPVLTQVIQGADTSDPGIPEATFRAIGAVQAARQKTRLWPHLAPRPELADPARFAGFLHDGTLLLNLLLRLNRDGVEGSAAGRLRGAFLERHERASATYGVRLDANLACLLLDAAQADFSAHTPDQNMKFLVQAIEALRESADQFGYVVSSQGPRHLFGPLAAIDSI
jgi:hypothetical protein